jgi:hypothetical protein
MRSRDASCSPRSRRYRRGPAAARPMSPAKRRCAHCWRRGRRWSWPSRAGSRGRPVTSTLPR